MDRGAWQATIHEVAKNQTQLSTHTYTWVTKRELLNIYDNSVPKRKR